MATVYRATISAWNPAAGGSTVPLYFSTGTGFVSKGSDSPANIYYAPRIKQPAFMRRDCFSSRRTYGRSEVSFGELILTNADGGLDAYAAYEYDGRAILLEVGTINAPGPITWVTVLSGKIEQAVFSWKEFTLRIRDRQLELDVPLNATKYAGTNSGATGQEGLPGDLQGKPKPQLWGKVYNIAPPMVNNSQLIYQVRDGAVASVDAVYDLGLVLTAGATYANLAAMTGTPPTAGQYRVWPGGGLFRLGSSPVGLVTADVTQGTTAADRTAAQIVKAIATGPGALVWANDFLQQDFTDLDTANSAVIGVYSADETTCAEMIDLACAAVGAYWSFDTSGKFRVSRLELPTGTATATLTDAEIMSIERVVPKDSDKGIPAWRVVLGYKRYWVVQNGPLAGAVSGGTGGGGIGVPASITGTTSTDRKAELAKEYRTVTAEDSAIKTDHLLATELKLDTVLTVKADADTEAARRLTLYGDRRDLYDVSVRVYGDLAQQIALGQIVTVVLPRYDLAAGRKFRVIGLLADQRKKRIEMTLWG